MKLLLRVRVEGIEAMVLSGPVLIVINHIALLDPVVVCGALPRLVTPVAKSEAFDSGILRFLLKTYGAIPIHRGEADVGAIKMALRVLQQGGAVLVAPEGTRSSTYQLQPAKEGVIRLALRSGAPIVPVGIVGTHEVKVHWKQLQRAPIRLSIGRPFYLQATNKRLARTETAALMTETMLRLAAQLPPEYRGVYDASEFDFKPDSDPGGL